MRNLEQKKKIVDTLNLVKLTLTIHIINMNDIISIEQDFENIINETINQQSKFWISKRSSIDNETNAKYFLIKIIQSNPLFLQYFHDDIGNKSEIKNSDEISMIKTSSSSYKVIIDGEQYNIRSNWKISQDHKFQITSNVFINDGVIVGNDKGELWKFEIENNNNPTDNNNNNEIINRKLLQTKSHYLSITKIKLFPSNQVILTVGLDKLIKLWSITSMNEPIRIMIDQTDEITDVLIIGKGRNFLSSSKDGSVNLWECSGNKVIYKFRRIDDLKDAANCILIEEGPKEKQKDTGIEVKDHYECNDKLLYVGYESGIIQQYDLLQHHQTRIKFKIDESESGSFSVKCMILVEDFLVAGYNNGIIIIWDTKTGEFKKKIKFNENYDIEKLTLINFTNENEVKLVFYNGPDTLIEMKIDLISLSDPKIEYLVGLPESFNVNDIDINYNGENLVIGGNDYLLIYKV